MKIADFEGVLVVETSPGIFVKPGVLLSDSIAVNPESERLIVITDDVVFELDEDGVKSFVHVTMARFLKLGNDPVTVFRQWARGAIRVATRETNEAKVVVFRPFSKFEKLQVYTSDALEDYPSGFFSFREVLDTSSK